MEKVYVVFYNSNGSGSKSMEAVFRSFFDAAAHISHASRSQENVKWDFEDKHASCATGAGVYDIVEEDLK